MPDEGNFVPQFASPTSSSGMVVGGTEMSVAEDMPAVDKPAHLEPSELGTKEYWDTLYTAEIENLATDPSNIGTVWFDDSDAEAKMVELLGRQADTPPSHCYASSPPLSRLTSSLLDLGCGNGSLLLALRAAGWTGRARGVDYSAKSIALARQIHAARASHGSEPVELAEWDIMAGPLEPAMMPDDGRLGGWDVVLDKGTFDAVSLSAETDQRGRRLCEGYRARLLRLLRPAGGLFVVTSCNWTEDELVRWFASPPARRQPGDDDDGHERERGYDADPTSDTLDLVDRVQYRSFSFGGAKGQTISTLCFRRR